MSRDPETEQPSAITLVIENTRLASGEPADIYIAGSRVAAVGVPGDLKPPAKGPVRVIDGAGLLALPGFINTHAHIDKTWWGSPWVAYGGVQSTEGRIAHERQERARYGIPSVTAATALLREMLRHGTTAIRSHVDVDLGVGLRGITAVHEAAASFAGAPEVQVVAFAQDGVMRRPGVGKLLDEAATHDGVTHVGGVDPASIDRDPVSQIDVLVEIAVNRGVGIDLHLHDGGSLGAFQVELIADRAIDAGLQGRVTISHGFCIGELDYAYQEDLLDRAAEAGLSWSTVAPATAAPLPWDAMRARGIDIGLGTDGVRDLWNPLGDGDHLSMARDFAKLHRCRADEDLARAVRLAGADSGGFVGRERQAIAEGAVADVVLLDAENPADAIARLPRREIVVARGQVVVERGELLV